MGTTIIQVVVTSFTVSVLDTKSCKSKDRQGVRTGPVWPPQGSQAVVLRPVSARARAGHWCSACLVVRLALYGLLQVMSAHVFFSACKASMKANARLLLSMTRCRCCRASADWRTKVAKECECQGMGSVRAAGMATCAEARVLGRVACWRAMARILRAASLGCI